MGKHYKKTFAFLATLMILMTLFGSLSIATGDVAYYIGGSEEGTLQEGETTVITLGGTNYEVTLVF